jgi:hypothetical protein
MCVPLRHDLPEWSCVNNEIKAFNRKLLKLMKLHKNVSVVTADTDRKVFTRHALHMINLGKEKFTSKVSTIVTNIFQKQNEKISLSWQNIYDFSAKSVSDNLTVDNISLQEDSKIDQKLLEDIEVSTANPFSDGGPRMSKRKKKPPTIRSENFLW